LDQAHHAVDRFGGLMIQRLVDIPGTEALRAEVLREAERYYVDFSRYAQGNHELQAELAKVQFRLAAIYAQLGRTQDAEKKYLESVTTFEMLQRRDHSSPSLQADLALCLHHLAALRKEQGRYSDALEYYRQAVFLLTPLVNRDRPQARFVREWAASQTNFGNLLWECSESEEASQRLIATQKALEDYLQRDPTDRETHQILIECRNTMVAILLDSAPGQAEELLRANIHDLEHWEGRRSTSSSGGLRGYPAPTCQLAIAQNNLAMLLGRQQKFAEAMRLVEASIDTLSQTVAEQPAPCSSQQQLAIAQNNRGQLLWSQSPNALAGESFCAAEAIFRQQLSANPPTPETLSRLGGVLHNRGTMEQHQGDLDSAVQHLTEAMELQALAIRKAPQNHGYRKYLELHRELLDRILRQIHQQTEAAREPPQVAATQDFAVSSSGQNGGF
ncbi:MAG: tetratricopeptide repeat protein, partial [Planctomycetales bacterium]|nr:tetratricopeptide repeat protein [Planctomycetales bacterium]